MGCWNTTCYISKLPICYGEPVVMILVRETYNEEGKAPHTCYATDKYVPFGYPVYGKYDDYGGIEEIENEEEVLEYLNTVTIRNSDNEIVEIAKENLCDTLNEIAHGESGLTIDKHAIEAFFVKRDLYKILIKEAETRQIYGRTETIGQQTKRLLKKELDKLHEEKFPDESFTTWKLSYVSIAKLSSVDMFWDITSYIKKKLFDNFNDEDFDRLLEIIMFHHVLEYLRMGYFCISGDGSQSNEMYMHTLVAQYVLDFAERSFREAQEDTREDLDKKEYLTETCYGYWEPKEE